MSQEITTLQSQHGDFFTPAFRILVDGKDLLTNYYMEIASVQVDNTLKGADRFAFTVNSTFNFETREFEHLQTTFGFGKPVEMRAQRAAVFFGRSRITDAIGGR